MAKVAHYAKCAIADVQNRDILCAGFGRVKNIFTFYNFMRRFHATLFSGAV